MTRPRCAVSIDLDSVACYYAIHGLGRPPEDLADLVLTRCVPRFLDLFETRGVRATFFVVGRDIDVGERGQGARAARQVLAQCLASGHELGNHSYSHPYDLARWDEGAAAREIGRAHQLITELGTRVVGFRAPGYDLSAAMLRELDRCDYLYDSSIFPAPGYYAAKLAIMGAMRAVGRKSGAVLTNPMALLAPAQPYRPSLRAPWRRGHARLVEVPIAVTRGLRVPAIGTSLLLAPEALRRRLLDGAGSRPVFNLELHGLDLADAETDGIPGELVARQPDLRLSVREKIDRLGGVLDHFAAHYEFLPLRDLAGELQTRV